MATKVTIDLEAKTDKAIGEIESLKEQIVKLNKQVAEGNDNTKKGLGGVEKATKGALGGVKKIGRGLKALTSGVGVLFLLNKAFEVFKEIGMKNQKVVDALEIAMESLSIVFNQFFTYISDNIGTVTGFFKDLFENPKERITELAESIKTGLLDRFNQLLEVFGLVGKAFGKLIKGEFSEAFDTIKQAGKEVVDVYTGVDDSYEKVAKTVTDYTKKVINSAKENVKLAKTAELAAVKNQGLIEKFDKQAEQLRQVRDDESKSFAERIKANEDLALVLDEQEKQMRANANLMVERAKTELDKNKDNIELQKAYQEALNEQAGIEAQITGFRSEQQTNANSLLREQKDLQNELALIGKSEREIERLELQQDYDAKKALIEREVTDEIKRKETLKNLEAEYNAQISSIDQAALDEKIDKANQEHELEKQKIQDKAMVVDAISQFANAETGIGKALLIAKQALALKETIMDLKRITFKGAEAVGQAGVSAAQNVAESSKIGFPQNIITIAAAIGQGIGIIKSVKSAVAKTKAKATGGGSTGVSTPSAATPSQPPQFNIVGAGGTNQLAEAIGSQEKQPVKAYVVSNDVTTAQSMDRNIVEGASI
jgi:phosphotransferase system IIB component